MAVYVCVMMCGKELLQKFCVGFHKQTKREKVSEVIHMASFHMQQP